ncbi:MAG: PilT/PilU family type 4a pilus ATPase [Candidatus Omnitrophica bacterium]|nr:PilT/PilU family type 4a pilus ATPase [Candidatus Omnitrophota bacterium]
MGKVEDLLKMMLLKEASDLYLKVGCPPCFRVYGKLFPEGDQNLTPTDMTGFVKEILTEEQERQFQDNLELDTSMSVGGVGRFRANVYYQRGTMGMVFRSIKSSVPNFEELGLPTKVLESLCQESRGLVLVTGSTGCGKSTTLASIVDYINTNMEKHILTIEDPIEFVHRDKKSIISQREIGGDTRSYYYALRHIMRQTPDVIYIGDIRDVETMTSAIQAAETGQLVISTLHTINTTQTVERIINFFPPYQHHEVRLQLSLLLKGVLSLRLIPRKDGKGRIPACEVMLLTPTIRGLIHDGLTIQIPSFIQDGAIFGMQTFQQALISLYQTGKITLEDARMNADNRDELDLALKGFHSGAKGFTGR